MTPFLAVLLIQAASIAPSAPATIGTQSTPETAPSARAEALGRQLAGLGTLAQLGPLMTAKDTEDLVADHPELSAADAATLRATAQAQAQTGLERLLAAEGHAYAQALSEDDLALLVFLESSDAAQRRRAATPGVIAATVKSLGSIDFKAETLAAFCAETGKACAEE